MDCEHETVGRFFLRTMLYSEGQQQLGNVSEQQQPHEEDVVFQIRSFKLTIM